MKIRYLYTRENQIYMSLKKEKQFHCVIVLNLKTKYPLKLGFQNVE